MFIFLTVGNAELDNEHGTLSRKWADTGIWLLGRKIGWIFVVFWSQSSQHCRTSAISLSSYFFFSVLAVSAEFDNCACQVQMQIEWLRVSLTVLFILRSSLVIPPPLCFFPTSLPLSLSHIWISLCSAFSLLLLCIVTGFFPPSLQFHLTGTLSNPEVLLWILSHSKF